MDPLTFYVGRVVRAFGENPEQSRQRDLSAHINRDKQTIKSLTGELSWDYKTGLVLVDTPRSQGAAGFLSRAGRIELRNVTIDCKNEFASVLVISLDDEPLATSKKILIQVMTEERPYGFKTEGNRITSLGGMPFGVKKPAVKVSLKLEGGGEAKVIALDENGYATDKSVTTRGDGVKAPLEIELAEDAIYEVVERP